MKKVTVLLGILLLSFFILDRLYPLKDLQIYKNNSFIIYDKNKEIISMQPSIDGFWVMNTNDIPILLKQSVILFEDKHFYKHFGINPFSIIRAFIFNLKHKNSIGASTITLQVARMIEPKERKFYNKLIEVFRAIQLELAYSKDEILNIYFNIAPYGGNIYGAKAAAYFYFQKDLNDLSTAQIALLSTIPKNPNKNRLDKKSNIKKVQLKVLNELLKNNIIDENTFKRARDEDIKNQRFDSIKNAYHYSNLCLKSKTFHTNLDLKLQKYIEDRAKILINDLAPNNANNLSVVVIDNALMQVIAYVGSHDLKSANGYNDGVLMKRSVGSTLKPFIYAKALENGLITPKQKLVDTNIYLKNYAPKNYYNEFLGVVNASDGLNFSLNTIAVFLNNKLGDDSLYELLKKADLVKESKSYYSNAIALGSIDLSLIDLAHLYTVFANDGYLKPLEYAGFTIDKNEKLLSKSSSYLVSYILQDALRSYLNSVWQNTANTPIIALKTGTSANSKDLYALAYNQNYTVGVWIGNFDAKPTNNLSGAKSSSKLIFEIFKHLSKTQKLSFFQKNEEITQEYICTDEFKYKTCKNYEKDLLIKGVKLIDKCELLNIEQINYLLSNKYISINDLSECDFKNKKPLIASPVHNSKYILDELEKKSKIMIKCLSFNDEEIYLKINDGEYFKAKSNDEILFDFSKGYHKIECLDKNSNHSFSEFEIKDFE